MKKLTFLLTEPNPVRGPYTLSQLRQMWAEKKINQDTELFLTWNNYETKDLICASLRAGEINKASNQKQKLMWKCSGEGKGTLTPRARTMQSNRTMPKPRGHTLPEGPLRSGRAAV